MACNIFIAFFSKHIFGNTAIDSKYSQTPINGQTKKQLKTHHWDFDCGLPDRGGRLTGGCM